MLHGDVLGERARISPGRTALVEVATGRRFTYSELDRRPRPPRRRRVLLHRRPAQGHVHLRGGNVYPAEVENELLQHPGVRDAAVVGVPHPTWGEVGIAFVVPTGEGTIPPGELEGILAGRLARFKVPKEFIVVAELPRTPYGKVVKGKLVQRYSSAHPGGTP